MRCIEESQASRARLSRSGSMTDTQERELLSAILEELRTLNRTVREIAVRGGGEFAPGRDRDPGDAVPPGIAPQEPVPLAPGDEQVRHALEELPHRAERAPEDPDMTKTPPL